MIRQHLTFFTKANTTPTILAKELHMCMEGYCSAYVYLHQSASMDLLADNDKAQPGER